MKEFANPQLDNEHLVSKILSGEIPSLNSQKLRGLICGLIIDDFSLEIDSCIAMLQKKLVTKLGVLKDDAIKAYLRGKDEEIYNLFCELDSLVKNHLALYHLAQQGAVYEILDSFDNTFAHTSDYWDRGRAIQNTALSNERLARMEQDKRILILMSINLKHIKDLYCTGSVTTKVGKFHSLSTAYKLYLNDMIVNSDKYVGDGRLAIVLGTAVDSIISAIPKDQLDPFRLDICNNLIKVLMKPEAFYTDCAEGRILSSEVGVLFNHAYPQFCSLFVEEFTDDYESLSYPKQINIRRAFGMIADDSELLKLCAPAIQLGYLKGDTI